MRLSITALFALTAFTLFAQDRVQAAQPEPVLSGRPSEDRPALPAYAPGTPAEGFELPPVPAQPAGVAPGAGLTLELKGVRFEGNTAFSDDRLAEIAADFLHRPVGRADLEDLRLRLTRFYIEHGYVNSGALLPDQDLVDGILTYRILEGALSEIHVQGTGDLQPDYLADRLRLDAGPPFNVNRMQDRFQLLLADPLIERMNGRLVPGSRRGEAALDLDVTRARPYGLSLSLDNYSPPSVGAERLVLNGWVRNLTGYGDLADLSIGFTEGKTSYYGGFAIPVTPRDTTLFARFEDSETSIVEESLDPLDIVTRIRGIEVGVSHPLYRTLNRSLDLGAKLAVRKSKNRLLGVPFSFSLGEEDGESQVTALRLTQDYARQSTQQVLTLRSTFSIGLTALDATDHGDEFPDSRYLAWLGQLRFAQRLLDGRGELRLRADLQLAEDELLPMERSAIGGRYSVRGYRENTLVRDNGYSASAEFRYRLAHSPQWGTLQVGPFVDYGRGWNKTDPQDGDTLFSVGLGVLWSWSDRVFAELYVATDIEQAVDQAGYDLQDDGIHFRIAADVF